MKPENCYWSCFGCMMKCGGPTLDFSNAGHRIYSNGCQKGYKVSSTAERPKRPAACIKDNAKVPEKDNEANES